MTFVTLQSAGDPALCRLVLESLPDWFGIPEAVEKYVHEAPSLPMLVAVVGDSRVGFLTLTDTGHPMHEIHLMGVLPDWHRRGIGRALVSAAVDKSRSDGAHALVVKTLAPDREDAAYAQTRAFYLALGFTPHRLLPDLWGPDNPCLELILLL